MFARGANLDALRSRGITVRTQDEEWTAPVVAGNDATELSRQFGEGDLVLVTTKAYSLVDVAPAVKTFAEKGATILPLNNGVESADHLAKLGVSAAQILGGVTYISAAKVEPGIVMRRNPQQRVIVGELPRGTSTRSAEIAESFVAAGVHGEATDDITLALWQKFVFLASIAAGCGLTRLPIGAVRDTKLGMRLLGRAVNEAVAVGRARGVPFSTSEEERVMAAINALPHGTEPSLLLDLRAGSRTEVDVLSGAISRFAGEAGLETPVHDVAAVALAVGH
jgi:2-dehydropantoate 2-reductase